LETNPMQGGPARRRGAIGQDDTRSPDHHCSEYLMAKIERDSKIRKRSYPWGVASLRCCTAAATKKGPLPSGNASFGTLQRVRET